MGQPQASAIRRHAYLILAHNEFELLRLLVGRLDDPRNDIYIHFDKKVEVLPTLQTAHAQLHILEERIDVRWADVSVLEAELKLLQTAQARGIERGYTYYHLLSGVDLPLKSQDDIHNFCERHEGAEFIGFYREPTLERDLERKVQRYHCFSRDFRGSGFGWWCKRIVRALAIRGQELIGYRRYPQRAFAKGTQWLSITHQLCTAIAHEAQAISRLYQNTFCSDEIAIHTFVAHSPFMDKVYDPDNEARSSLRHIGWDKGELKDFTSQDYTALADSPALFARKFNSRDMAFIHRILELSAPRTHAAAQYDTDNP